MTRFRIIQLARLGDLLQSLPLCRALRERGEVELVLPFDPGQRLRREADRLRIVEPWSLARAARRPALFLHRLRDALGGDESLDAPVDLQICLNEDPAARALARLLPARRRLGAGVAGDAYPRWLRLAVEHRRENHLQLAEAMLACLPGEETPAPRAAESGSGDLVLHAGSGSAARQLSMEFWNRLARELLERVPHRRLLLTGGLLEQADCAELERRIQRPDRVLNVSGSLDLDELQDLLDSAALVLAQDTGVLHLAAHLRRPLIGLYHGSASARETAPWLDGAHVLQIRADCAPCVEGQPTCTDYFCRSRIRPDETARLGAALLGVGDIPDLSSAECSHWICRADPGGVRLVPVQGAEDPTASGERGRQLFLLRGLEFGATPRDLTLSHGRDWARQSGLAPTAWRDREWFHPPQDLVGQWHWLQAGDPQVEPA